MKHILQVDRMNVLKIYNKTEEDVQDYLQILYDWLKTQSHLPPIEEEQLQSMILNCKFSIEKTKTLIDNYFTFRSLAPELFCWEGPLSPHIQSTARVMTGIPLVAQTPACERIIIHTLLDNDPDKFVVQDSNSYMLMVSDYRLKYDFSNGIHLIFDFGAGKLAHLSKLSLSVTVKEGYKSRIQGFHIVNPPPFVDFFMTMFKAGMSSKVYKRVKIHKTFDTLHEILSKDLLPSNYGGNLKTIEELNDEWLDELSQRHNWFLELSKKSVDETQRKEKLRNDIFGSIHGSFKNLNVD